MKKLKRRGLHDQVLEEIGKEIICGKLAPGKPLPAEEHLCRVLGVSRTALREALRVLASKGLVEPKRKLGTLVRRNEHWNFLDAEILSWLLEAGDSERAINELYELRHLIEPLAASLAAQRAGPRDVEVLRNACSAMKAAGDDGERFAGPDLEFHKGIIRASGNRLFASLAHVIEAALRVNFRLVRDVPHGHTRSLPLHERVLETIERHDAPAARLAMQRLIDDSQRDASSVGRGESRGPVRVTSKSTLGRPA